MDSLVSTEWLARASRRARPRRRGCELAHAGERPQRPRGISRGAHSRRPLPRHRRGQRPRQPRAAHAAERRSNSARRWSGLASASDDRIVVYDNSPDRTAARGWFMFRHFGARAGRDPRRRIPEMARRRAARPRAASRQPRHARLRGRCERATRSSPSRRCSAGNRRCRWLDARGKPPVRRQRGRSAARRRGRAHPGRAQLALRRALPRGRDASSPSRRCGGCSPRPASIRRKPFVASCGSGVTANSLIFAAHLLGNDEAELYDGSWSEWGADPATPKALGPA